MAQPFDYFVVLAEMRTGSNFLEENINAFDGLKCWGEVFNPAFIGHSKKSELLGISMGMREEDPFQLIGRMREETAGLAGFRFFHDHDPRILEEVLSNPRCAKIILTRNPVESYVSRKIASATGQWRLGDMKDAKTAQISFDKAEFEEMLGDLQAHQMRLMRALQESGQAAFYIGYDDIQDIAVLNGLARFLGHSGDRERTSNKTKVQNPAGLREKVVNYDEMVRDLSGIDHFNLGRTPNFEPRRGPNVPRYVAGAKVPLLFMPLKGAPEAEIIEWMAALEGGDTEILNSGFGQKELRQWKRQSRGHRSFTVLRHPVARLHGVFCTYILAMGPGTFSEIRETLRTTYKVPLPKGAPDTDYGPEQHREAFLGFLRFVQGNLSGQTSIRVDAAWATQTALMQGMGDFMLPDMVVREESLAADLAHLSGQVGVDPGPVPAMPQDGPVPLEQIYDADIEKAARQAHRRDFMMFGFRNWDKR